MLEELLLYEEPLDDELLPLYTEVLPELRGTVPSGLLYVAVDLLDVAVDLPDVAVGLLEVVDLLPIASRLEAVELVPNELLLVVDTLLVTFPWDGEAVPPDAMMRLPAVLRRDPL